MEKFGQGKPGAAKAGQSWRRAKTGSACAEACGRDQQADRAGMELKRRILHEVAAADPEPAGLQAALLRIAVELGEPSGPARAVAAQIYEEWRMACSAPEW